MREKHLVVPYDYHNNDRWPQAAPRSFIAAMGLKRDDLLVTKGAQRKDESHSLTISRYNFISKT